MENNNINSKLIVVGDTIFIDGKKVKVKTIDGVTTGDNCVVINRKYQVRKNETVKLISRPSQPIAAQSEQSEMVKKSEVLNTVKEHLSYFNSTGPIGTQLTELLTKLKDL